MSAVFVCVAGNKRRRIDGQFIQFKFSDLISLGLAVGLLSACHPSLTFNTSRLLVWPTRGHTNHRAIISVSYFPLCALRRPSKAFFSSFSSLFALFCVCVCVLFLYLLSIICFWFSSDRFWRLWTAIARRKETPLADTNVGLSRPRVVDKWAKMENGRRTTMTLLLLGVYTYSSSLISTWRWTAHKRLEPHAIGYVRSVCFFFFFFFFSS